MLLEVIEGYGGGQAVFEVFDDEVSLGNTTDVPFEQGSTSCEADPTACNVDDGVTKGKFVLQKNVQYDLRIVARRSDYGGAYDGGWFRLTSAACGNESDSQGAATSGQAGRGKYSLASISCLLLLGATMAALT